ncbi:hypothetical protein CK203_020268 [Vitis vinifera]|uniref:Uncharacterized protein n=1 Tax=Vitis vinifera TaxID=29760 RepID=A0A438J8H4_VITVI|nr:hypothetical protein CK203_020268 [Vitis vinifera]
MLVESIRKIENRGIDIGYKLERNVLICLVALLVGWSISQSQVRIRPVNSTFEVL